MFINFHIKVPIVVKKKENGFVSSCPVLDVVSQGDSEREARKNIKEAVSLFLSSCFNRGTLDKVLKDCGFKTVNTGVQIRKESRKTPSWIDVPIPFQINQTSISRQCHA